MPVTHARKPTGHALKVARKRGDVWYLKLRLPDPQRPGRLRQTKKLLGPAWAQRGRPPEGYYTQGKAEEKLREVLVDASRDIGTTVPGTVSHTFGEACELWLAYLATDRGRGEKTVRDYRASVDRHLTPALGADTDIGTITTEQVEEVKEALLAKGLSRRSVQKLMVMLYGICKRAKRKKWIATNPCEDAERVKLIRSGDFNVLTVEEVYAVAREADDAQDAALFVVAALTGLRQGELLALKWRDVDFVGRVIHVRQNFTGGQLGAPKSKKVRSLPMADQVAVKLDGLSRRDEFTQPGDLVFANPLGDYLDAKLIRTRFYGALKRAGLGHRREGKRPMVFHDLRHTFGTLCASSGVPVGDIQVYMGHSDVKTTQIYMHHAPKHDAAAKLTAAFVVASDVGEPVASTAGTEPGTE